MTQIGFLFACLLSTSAITAAPSSSLWSIEKTITVDGLSRSYLVYVPQADEDHLPLVLAFHGGGSKALQMERYSRFNTVAAKQKFIVAYPEAVDGHWNDGRGLDFVRSQGDNIDDVKFVRSIVDDIDRRWNLDRSRVFATGISNGAFISHRLAAEASDVFAAVAPVVGGMAPAIAEKFRPDHPVSLFVIQGDSDPLVPLHGGEVGFLMGRKRGKLIATREVIAKYVRANGVTGEPKISQLKDADPDDGTTTEVTVYPPGTNGSRVQIYLVKNGGHTWPGRPLYLSERLIGKTSQDFHASEVIWKFFESCPPRKKSR